MEALDNQDKLFWIVKRYKMRIKKITYLSLSHPVILQLLVLSQQLYFSIKKLITVEFLL